MRSQRGEPKGRTTRPLRTNAGQLPSLITIEEVADHLGVTVRHVRRLVAERRIPYVKWGHLLRFDALQVQAWLDEQRVDPRWGAR